MILHHDLLEQAFHLALRERKKPRQASLRRSVSASYYALFHLLIYEATKRICPGNDRIPLRNYLMRTFQHSNMRNVAKQFFSNSIPENLRSAFGVNTLDEKLIFVASSFVTLQKARHDADYDFDRFFLRHEAIGFARMTKNAFESWRQVRGTIQADAFLIGLHNQKNINK